MPDITFIHPDGTAQGFGLALQLLPAIKGLRRFRVLATRRTQGNPR